MIGKYKRGTNTWRILAFSTPLLLAMSQAGIPSAQAATSSFEPFSEARQLSDDELSIMRGRFVDRGRLMYFGVQMSSEWRTAAGEHIRARAGVMGDLSGGTPRVSFEPVISVVDGPGLAASGGNGAVVVDGGTPNARGVVQSIQAGGDFNTAANELQVDILDAAGTSVPTGSAGVSRVERHLTSGTRVAVSASGNDFSVDMKVPGIGHVSQAILPGQGLHQRIQLSSSLQRVHNLTRLQLYMNNRPTIERSMGIRSAMRMASQLRR
ncbi:hypothetical protein VO226_13280 [Halomonas elongata]|uniref:hypothetical protein n=1 Tax=Halomonas elongata TaxID=2746 RepID=UPI002E2B8BF2|nr:hypothetical protein [Halomonas elongata]WVI70888.1 hypothetical protein VO226_13280 [Halomonas elongata]